MVVNDVILVNSGQQPPAVSLPYLTLGGSGSSNARNHPVLRPPSDPMRNPIVTVMLSEPLVGSYKPYKRTPAHPTEILCLHNI